MQPFVKTSQRTLDGNHGALLTARIFGRRGTSRDLWNTRRRSRSFRVCLRVQRISADAIEKLINVARAAGYLGESARGTPAVTCIPKTAQDFTHARRAVELLSQAVMVNNR
jgi:hypothetical protein